MKKFSQLFVATAICVTTMATVLYGCKKQEEGPRSNSAAQTEQGMSPSERKVLDFLADYEAVKRGAKAEGEAVTPEEARWQWETTLNYCYGFPDETLCNTRLDTVRVAMPKTNEEGYLDYGDILEAYGNIVATVREVYKAIDLEDKTLQLVMLRLEKCISKDDVSDSLDIVLNTGSNISEGVSQWTQPTGPWYVGPFDKDDDWIWGLDQGRCDGTEPGSDAADQLNRAIAYYDFIYGQVQNPCPTCHLYFVDGPNVEFLYIGLSNDWVFSDTCSSSGCELTYCIEGEELEYYYEQILLHTHTENMETNPIGYYGYYKTDVSDVYIGSISPISVMQHVVRVYYATKVWRDDNGTTYPIPLDGNDD